MRSKIIKVGNSKGVIIPPYLIKKYNFEGEVEIEIQGNGILIKPFRHPRPGWEEAFKELSEDKSNLGMSNEFPPTDFEMNEW